MSTLPKKIYTPQEYLERELRSDFKSEFFRGEIFAMAGASREHVRVRENLIIEIGGRLKGGPCQTLSGDQRVLVDATGLYTYPDLVILCGQGEYAVTNRDTLTNPTAIIEVLSPSTEKYDRGAKFRNYQQIDSLTEYVLVYQDEPVIERFVRLSDGSWGLVSFVGLNDTLVFISVPVRIPLEDVYRGVSFPEVQPGNGK
jgi:Uma2 family endonuclease